MALVSIMECVLVVMLLLIKMVCSDCASVMCCARSDAWAFTLGLRGDVVWVVSAPPLRRRQRSKRGARRAVG